MSGQNHQQPRVSILIPNFNNGRQSSRDGQTDLIGDLLRSLHATLLEDPTPLEIIAYDDGSTDDSLDTLRTYTQMTWPSGQPLIELIESEHCGVLAKTANVLSRKARGDILVRLDGDTVILTNNWAQKLCAIFDHAPPRLGVVGPKQLTGDGRIHAFGDWLLHPIGYHHIGAGLPREAIRWPVECDHVMGCFYCCRKQVFDDLGGYDETLLRGQTVDFGLRARLHGYSCIAVPQIEFIHRHGMREHRQTTADTDEGVRQTLATFENKWGFNRISPDLDVVRDRYDGTPLLWHPRWFALQGVNEADTRHAADHPLSVDDTEWVRLQNDQTFRQHVQRRVEGTLQLLKQMPGGGKTSRIYQVGSRCGLIAHLLATQGIAVTAIEHNAAEHNMAQRCTAEQTYTQCAPRFVHQTERRTLPIEDGGADIVLLLDALERDPNPVGLLKEARRALSPGGMLLVMGQQRGMHDESPTADGHRYNWPQLANQLSLAIGAQVLNKEPRQGPDLLALAKPAAEPTDQPDAVPPKGEADTLAAAT